MVILSLFRKLTVFKQYCNDIVFVLDTIFIYDEENNYIQLFLSINLMENYYGKKR